MALINESVIIPPANLLPPNPPIIKSNEIEKPKTENRICLPKISQIKNRNKNKQKYKTISKNSTCLIDKKLPLSIGIQTENNTNTTNFVCRICGLDCGSNEMLYAHLLILIHKSNVQLKSKLSYICRRCGKKWNSDDTKLNLHLCVQQKAIYFKRIQKPKNFIKYGPPFICLYCCVQPINASLNCHTNNELSKLIFKPHETAYRFKSKLHLVVHIMCKHAITKPEGFCGECSFQNKKEQNHTKTDSKFVKNNFSDKLSTSNFYRSSSSDSICKRKRLSKLENHIDMVHLIQMEWLYWFKNSFQENWIYACPLCEMMCENLSTPPENYLPALKLTNNALLQAHVVCYHSNIEHYNWFIGQCQICKVLNQNAFFYPTKNFNLNQYLHTTTNHLIKAGHTKRLKSNFQKAVRQGRINLDVTICEQDFSTTCFLCWQKFCMPSDFNDKFKILLGQCQLQTHLLSHHCQFSNSTSIMENQLRPCGWCGKSLTSDFDESKI